MYLVKLSETVVELDGIEFSEILFCIIILYLHLIVFMRKPLYDRFRFNIIFRSVSIFLSFLFVFLPLKVILGQ